MTIIQCQGDVYYLGILLGIAAVRFKCDPVCTNQTAPQKYFRYV